MVTVVRTTRNSPEAPGLEQWLWEAACQIRGAIDAPKYKDFILPLIFLKRISDVFEDELRELAQAYGSRATAERLVERDHGLVRFYLPEPYRWPQLRRQQRGLGEYLDDAVRAIARENPKLAGAIDAGHFNQTSQGQRVLGDDALHNLIEVLNQRRLGLDDVRPDILGGAYEYLLRKFAEGQGQSAGEFFTPPEVAALMARLLAPRPGESVYDPACGSGGLLIHCAEDLLGRYGDKDGARRGLPADVAPLRLYGQEWTTPPPRSRA